MADESIEYTWERSLKYPWTVTDWQGNKHEFSTEKDQIAFIERDQRMLAAATRQANADVITQITDAFQNQEGLDSGERTDHASGEGEKVGTSNAREGNRRSRRRNGRHANREKASR